LHAVLLIWSVYFFSSRLFSRRVGLLAAIIVGTSPLTTFLGRQAVADILVVTYTTMAGGFFALAIFGTPAQREQATANGTNPPLHLPYLYLFYALIGLALLAKGLLGAAIPGITIVGYMLLCNDWSLLGRMRLISGAIVTLVIALPWYVQMSFFHGRNIDDGKTFWDRFIIHDNFQRVFQGVHGERGHFAYFIRQLGYSSGMWFGFLPLAVFAAARWRQARPDFDEKLKRYLFSWWFFTLLFFSFSQTKFHHYVFPLIPISAILVAVWLDRFLERQDNPLYNWSLLFALAIFGVAIRDILIDPHHLVNLFVYKYSRPYPWGDPMFLFGWDWKIQFPPFDFFGLKFYMSRPFFPTTPTSIMGMLTVVACVFFLACHLGYTRRFVVIGLASVSIVWTAYYSLDWMPMLTKHWSQKHLFEALKRDSPLWRKLLQDPWSNALKEKIPDEPLFAFRMNWRGEKFYSGNRDLQIMGRNSYTRLYDALQRHKKTGRPVYFLTEANRLTELQRAVGTYNIKRLKIIASNNKYLLAKLDPRPKNEVQSPHQLQSDVQNRTRYDNWQHNLQIEQRRKNTEAKQWKQTPKRKTPEAKQWKQTPKRKTPSTKQTKPQRPTTGRYTLVITM
jgi:hypothetical protein